MHPNTRMPKLEHNSYIEFQGLLETTLPLTKTCEGPKCQDEQAQKLNMYLLSFQCVSDGCTGCPTTTAGSFDRHPRKMAHHGRTGQAR